jgi:Fe-S-cluster containining protein
MSELLANYRQLVARVDELCRQITNDWGEYLVCRPGCDSCCRHLRLFPVEAAALAVALDGLSPQVRDQLLVRAAGCGEDDPCPLLIGGLCQLYADRPLICRTHGLPLLLEGEEGRRIDFCPRNFQGVAALPAGAVIDLEKLNTALTAINRLFAQQQGLDDAARLRLIAEVVQAATQRSGHCGG